MAPAAANNSPARLTILFAKDASVAVILRRGPRDKYQLIHWDTDNDKFEFGQWFYGRMHEERSDISPDGQLFVYCAAKPIGREHSWWTAISRPPFFTAMALWFHDDNWGGACRFVSNHALALAGVPRRVPHEGDLPKNFKVIDWDAEWESPSVHSKFQYFERVSKLQTANNWPENQRPCFRRAQPDGSGSLWFVEDEKKRNTIGVYVLHDPYSIERAQLPDVEWANWDRRGRLITAYRGKIFVRDGGKIAGESRLLIDLNETSAKTYAAPDWACKWPENKK